MKLVLYKKMMLETQWKGKWVDCDTSVNDTLFSNKVVDLMAGSLSRGKENEKKVPQLRYEWVWKDRYTQTSALATRHVEFVVWCVGEEIPTPRIIQLTYSLKWYKGSCIAVGSMSQAWVQEYVFGSLWTKMHLQVIAKKPIFCHLNWTSLLT